MTALEVLHVKNYPVVTLFDRQFKNGNLAGITLRNCVLRHANTAAARRWLAGVKNHAEIYNARIEQ